MALYLIGIGLNDEKDITLKGLEAIRKCSRLFLETYTSRLGCPIEELEKLYGRKIVPATRELVENRPEETILPEAKEGNAALLVIGDPLAATTHVDLLLRAKKLGIETHVIHNASIMSAIAATGLQVREDDKHSLSREEFRAGDAL
jgi:diphthine synthase